MLARVSAGSSPALLHEKLHVGRLFRIVEEVPLMSAYAELICCIGHQLTDMLYLRAAKKRPDSEGAIAGVVRVSTHSVNWHCT